MYLLVKQFKMATKCIYNYKTQLPSLLTTRVKMDAEPSPSIHRDKESSFYVQITALLTINNL